MKKEIKIEGMRCSACSTRVEAALNGLNGVNAVVDLANATACVEMSAPIDDAVLKDEIESLGFDVVSISEL